MTEFIIWLNKIVKMLASKSASKHRANIAKTYADAGKVNEMRNSNINELTRKHEEDLIKLEEKHEARVKAENKAALLTTTQLSDKRAKLTNKATKLEEII